jgi:predicted RNase H-like nuclease (RuvC/YqgF family)
MFTSVFGQCILIPYRNIITEGLLLVKCPKCGTEAGAPVKTWTITRKTSRPEQPQRIMGIFQCSSCNARFRAVLETEREKKPEDKISIKNMVERIRVIKGELMQTLKNLREKIKTLETERANLMLEIEELKKMAESKVNALESEVAMLREEVKSLKELLGYPETETK